MCTDISKIDRTVFFITTSHRGSEREDWTHAPWLVLIRKSVCSYLLANLYNIFSMMGLKHTEGHTKKDWMNEKHWTWWLWNKKDMHALTWIGCQRTTVCIGLHSLDAVLKYVTPCPLWSAACVYFRQHRQPLPASAPCANNGVLQRYK